MAIHRKKAKPAHNHPDLVTLLVKYLDPKESKAKGEGIPEIYEIAQTYGNSMHVHVIWNQWEGVPHPERGPIILDAYAQARGDLEMLRIAIAQGFTPEEAKRLNVTGGIKR
jgi:hypothetical protein